MPTQQVIGKTPEQLSPEQQPDGRRSRDLVREKLTRALGGESFTFEWVHSRADGSEVIMEISLGASGPQHSATLLCFWRDITARKRAEDELLRSREELRALTARLDAVREQEQLALSRELHDGLGQILTAMKIDAALLKRLLDTRVSDIEGREIIASLDDLTDSALRMSRDLARSIRPVMLEEIGLAQALQRLIADTAQRGQLAHSVHVDCDVSKLPHAHALALYRIAQEACTNILRHAHASELRAQLFETAKMIGIVISDNGQGFAMLKQEQGSSLGLVGMRERAVQLGGTVHIISEPQRGTRVTATLPKPDAASDAENEHADDGVGKKE
jgi:PAS domain S-box-containing protein